MKRNSSAVLTAIGAYYRGLSPVTRLAYPVYGELFIKKPGSDL